MFVADLMKNKRILVTGGGTGLGLAIAERLLGLGAEVHICGRRASICAAAADELMARHGGTVVAHCVDIRDADAVDRMTESIFSRGPLTGLVNNAAGNFISRTEDLSPRGFNAIADIVMRGTFYVTHSVGRRWIANRLPGSVVSIIVTWVKNGGPFVVPSTMSKSAVHAMTMSLAAEWGRYGIRLNCVGPGEIPTEGASKRLNPTRAGARTASSNPMGRCGQLSELQNLATFLLSDGCDWLTGQSIMLDGGHHLATGGNFYDMRHWTDEQWNDVRARIKEHNERDRALRTSSAGT